MDADEFNLVDNLDVVIEHTHVHNLIDLIVIAQKLCFLAYTG